MRRMAMAAVAGVCAGMVGCASGDGARVERESSAQTAVASFRCDRLTRAEASDFRATMLYDEVVAFVDELAESPLAHRVSMGATEEGRDLPVLVIADPPVRTAREALESGKVRFFAFGGIHSGECCGKEALLMYARDLLNDPRSHRDVLDSCVLMIAPLYNADGNERVSVDNRRGQNGPELGMGERANANGLDLNRDFVKLASAEGRSMIGLFNEWDPHVVFDSHTTNGSYHRYTLTYDGAMNPSGDMGLVGYTRDEFLPDVSARMEAETGYLSFFYGNFDRELTKWGTYSHMPRYGANYVGLRNRIAILSEAYAYATFEDRVRSTEAFLRECVERASEDSARIVEMCARADRASSLRTSDEVGIAYEVAPFDAPVVIKSYELAKPDPDRWGVRPIATEDPVDYEVEHWGTFTPTKTVPRPMGYLVPESHGRVVEKLREHGVRVEPLTERTGVTIERYRIDSIERAARAFQGVRGVTLGVSKRGEWIAAGEGWTFVPTDQPLGNLAVYLLEPESDDGLAHWDLVDTDLSEGSNYPILRVLGISER